MVRALPVGFFVSDLLLFIELWDTLALQTWKWRAVRQWAALFCIERNWVRWGGSSQTNDPLSTCVPFWYDSLLLLTPAPFTVALFPPGSVLSTKNKPVGVDRLLACVYCDAAIYWLIDVKSYHPPSAPRLVGSSDFSWLCGVDLCQTSNCCSSLTLWPTCAL